MTVACRTSSGGYIFKPLSRKWLKKMEKNFARRGGQKSILHGEHPYILRIRSVTGIVVARSQTIYVRRLNSYVQERASYRRMSYLQNMVTSGLKGLSSELCNDYVSFNTQVSRVPEL